MTKFRLLIYTVFLTILQVPLTSNVHAQLPIKVEVSVSGPKHIADSISSFVKRELRTLPDVEVVRSAPTHYLDLIAVEMQDKQGRSMGLVAVSAISTSLFDSAVIKKIVDPKNDIIVSLLPQLARPPLAWLRTGSVGDIRSICENIVASVDVEVYESVRRSTQLLK